jgi:mono/diheme cytochrome c family protein
MGDPRRSSMRTLSLAMVLLLAACTALAKDAAAIYKSKCAGCHGAQGEGKSGPKLGGTSLSEDDIVNVLTKGGQPKAPHTKAFPEASEAKAKQLAAYVKSLK